MSTFAAVTCLTAKYRDKDDFWNPLVGGTVGGAYFGLIGNYGMGGWKLTRENIDNNYDMRLLMYMYMKINVCHIIINSFFTYNPLLINVPVHIK